MHRNALWDHTQKLNAPEFWIFALKVKHGNSHLTTLTTADHHHIHMLGRYGQGQYTPMIPRSE